MIPRRELERALILRRAWEQIKKSHGAKVVRVVVYSQEPTR